MYHMVQQPSSQALDDRVTRIEEILHNTNLMNNIVQDRASHKNFVPELRRDPKEVKKYLSHRRHMHHNLSTDLE